MAVSARLRRDVAAKLTRFCRTEGISKTEAIERGIELLVERTDSECHPAYAAYLSLKLVPESKRAGSRKSSDAMKTAIRARYSA
jgi:hypothetical protein